MGVKTNGSLSEVLALERYKKGMCPCCEKAIGDPRGLEFRAKSDDLFCHTCRRQWPMMMDLDFISHEFAHLQSSVPKFRTLNVAEQALDSNTADAVTEARFLRKFLRRFALRR
jgi:hypothetical protein